MSINNHIDKCPAPICAYGKDQDNAVWLVGESICQIKTKFTKKQLRLNRRFNKGSRKNLNKVFTLRDLI